MINDAIQFSLKGRVWAGKEDREKNISLAVDIGRVRIGTAGVPFRHSSDSQIGPLPENMISWAAYR